ncbi:MAG: hypothetical protein AAF960_07850 [Bacteroidota bacterium]
MKGLILFFSLLLVALLACSKKVKPTTSEVLQPEITPTEKAEKVAQELFKSNYSVDFNSSKTVACITKSFKKRPNDIFPTLSFILYHPATEAILFKETIGKAKGRWKNDDEFLVTVTPGQMSRNSDVAKKQSYLFNIKTKTKRRM